MTATTKGKRLGYAVIGIIVGVCAVGWSIIVAHSEGRPGITPQVVSWQVGDHSVRVRYQVSKPKGEVVHCSLIAMDTKHAEVGRAQVTVPAGKSSVDVRQELPISAPATAIDLKECQPG